MVVLACCCTPKLQPAGEAQHWSELVRSQVFSHPASEPRAEQAGSFSSDTRTAVCARWLLRMSVFHLSLHWDGRVKGILLHPDALKQLQSESAAAEEESEGQTKKTKPAKLNRHQQKQSMGRITLAAARASFSLVLPLLEENSVPTSTAVVPLAYAQLAGWDAGMEVRLEHIIARRKAWNEKGILPLAHRVHAEVWPPGVGVRRQTSATAASTSHAQPFRSAPLGTALHSALLLQPFIAPSFQAHASAPVTLPSNTAEEFRILQWQGMACLVRIVRVTTLVAKDTPATDNEVDEEGADTEDSEEEVDVPFAEVDEDTEIECDVMPAAAASTASASEQSIAGVSTAIPPLFPHILPGSDSSISPSLERAEDVSVAGCFPQEWRALHQFLQNALTSHSSASASATNARSTLGFQWGIPRAMLIAASSGMGKSTFLHAFAAFLPGERFVIKRISGAALVGAASDNAVLDHYNTLRQELLSTTVSDSASFGKAGILILEDMDAIICHRSHPRHSTQLLALLERIQSTISNSPATQPLILLLSSVRSFDLVPSHFLSSGRFEAVIKFQLLTREQRRKLVKQVLTKVQEKVGLAAEDAPKQEDLDHGASASFAPSATDNKATSTSSTPLDVLSHALSAVTPGFLARDLALLVQHALLHAGLRWDKEGTERAQARLRWEDLSAGLRKTHPSQGSTSAASLQLASGENAAASALAFSAASTSSDSFPTIGGYAALKKRLSLTLFHWLHPSRIQALGLRPISGVLFTGPSGCGKSLFAGALAKQAGLNFVAVSVASVFSAYFGESERKIRALFAQAGQLAPCVLLLDHVDALAGKRDGEVEGAQGVDARVLSTLLNEMDGISRRPGVYVVGCTQHPSRLDSALMRPGRFDDVIEVNLPREQDRKEILKIIMKKVTLASDVSLDSIALATEGMTGADLCELVSKAGMNALRADPEKAESVSQRNFDDALRELTGGAA